MRKSYSGKYKPKNKQKYKGDCTNIVYRSLLERSFMVWCDLNDDIVEWQSEELVIPYISPLDNSIHRYFTDFKIKQKCGAITVIEVKPESQTVEPNKPKTNNKKSQIRYIQECQTYAVNMAKWNAAQAYCDKHGYKFVILTEKDIRKIVKTRTKKS